MAGGQILDGIARVTGRAFPISAIRVRKFCENTQFKADHLWSSAFRPRFSIKEGLTNTIRADFTINPTNRI
jgi:hypothetical protein